MNRVFFIRVGYVIGAFVLAMYWLLAIAKFKEGETFAYKTFYNLDMTVVGLGILLFFFTLAWFITIRKNWNGIPKNTDND